MLAHPRQRMAEEVGVQPGLNCELSFHYGHSEIRVPLAQLIFLLPGILDLLLKTPPTLYTSEVVQHSYVNLSRSKTPARVGKLPRYVNLPR